MHLLALLESDLRTGKGHPVVVGSRQQSQVLKGVDEVVAECRLINMAAEGYLIYPRDLEVNHLDHKSGRWCMERSTNG